MVKKVAMAELFNIDNESVTHNKLDKKPIMLAKRKKVAELDAFYPEVDPDYVFPVIDETIEGGNISPTKAILIAILDGTTALIHGPHGCGKTTLPEQICARLNIPLIRAQHTEGMEPSQIFGETQAGPDGTYFLPALLPLAMEAGMVYLADEYDRATNGITSEYQAILEGNPLIMPSVPLDKNGNDWRKTVPHENFRFVATGNTNGQGDETGNYMGVQIGNAANYSRFEMTVRMDWIKPKDEVKLLTKKAAIKVDMASNLVTVANKIRDGKAKAASITTAPSTRELIAIANLGMKFASMEAAFKVGYTNRLPSGQAAAADQIYKTVVGS